MIQPLFVESVWSLMVSISVYQDISVFSIHRKALLLIGSQRSPSPHSTALVFISKTAEVQRLITNADDNDRR